jgi:prepilin-type processing-associated H-X9-DG protein
LRASYQGIMGAEYACPLPATVPAPIAAYTMGNCPANARVGGYATNGIIYPDSKINLRRVTDGSSNTIIVGEVSWRGSGPTRTWIVGGLTGGGWVYAAENVRYPMKEAFRAEPPGESGFGNNHTSLGSEHPGGAHVCMADGSVQLLSEDIAVADLRPLASRDAGDLEGQGDIRTTR